MFSNDYGEVMRKAASFNQTLSFKYSLREDFAHSRELDPTHNGPGDSRESEQPVPKSPAV